MNNDHIIEDYNNIMIRDYFDVVVKVNDYLIQFYNFLLVLNFIIIIIMIIHKREHLNKREHFAPTSSLYLQSIASRSRYGPRGGGSQPTPSKLCVYAYTYMYI